MWKWNWQRVRSRTELFGQIRQQFNRTSHVCRVLPQSFSFLLLQSCWNRVQLPSSSLLCHVCLSGRFDTRQSHHLLFLSLCFSHPGCFCSPILLSFVRLWVVFPMQGPLVSSSSRFILGYFVTALIRLGSFERNAVGLALSVMDQRKLNEKQRQCMMKQQEQQRGKDWVLQDMTT